MRRSSHVTIHIAHRRVQTRSPQRCKKVPPRLDEHLGKMLSGQLSSSFILFTYLIVYVYIIYLFIYLFILSCVCLLLYLCHLLI